jgi:hypothetical protein
VKLFINCKNSKRKTVRHSISPFNEEVKESEAEDVITKKEVLFTGRENIEGYACLINVFIKQLM